MAFENVCPNCCSTVLRMEKHSGTIKWYCMKCHKRSDMLKTVETHDGQMSKEAFDEVKRANTLSNLIDSKNARSWGEGGKLPKPDLWVFYRFRLSTFETHGIYTG